MIGSELPITASGERQISTGHRSEKETLDRAYETRGDSNRAEAVRSVSASGNRQRPKWWFRVPICMGERFIISWKIKVFL